MRVLWCGVGKKGSGPKAKRERSAAPPRASHPSTSTLYTHDEVGVHADGEEGRAAELEGTEPEDHGARDEERRVPEHRRPQLPGVQPHLGLLCGQPPCSCAAVVVPAGEAGQRMEEDGPEGELRNWEGSCGCLV